MWVTAYVSKKTKDKLDLIGGLAIQSPESGVRESLLNVVEITAPKNNFPCGENVPTRHVRIEINPAYTRDILPVVLNVVLGSTA